METRRLRYFIQIVESGSISKAAAKLDMAQPALSQQLSVLEREVKLRLVERTNAGIILTEAGRKLYDRAHAILRQIEGVQLEMRAEAGEVAGIAAIGFPPSQRSTLANPLLLRARERHPLLRLRIVEDVASVLSSQLQSGVLDLLVSSVRLNEQAFQARALFDEEMFLVCAPGLHDPAWDLEQLAALPWIVTPAPNAMLAQMHAVFGPLGLQPNIVAEVNSMPIVVNAIRQGLGVSLLSKSAVCEELAAGAVVAVPMTDPPMRRSVFLYRRHNADDTAAIRAVEAILNALVAERRA